MATKGTLKYRKVSRTPQVGKEAGKKKYYATAVQDREMGFEDFVTHVADHNSPYSRGTVHGVLMDTLDCLKELVLDGKSVRFSDLGLFSLGMSSKGEETPDKVTAASIKGVHLIVRNTKSWSNSELRKSCKITSYGTGVTDEADGGTTPDDPNQPSNPSQPGGSGSGGSASGGNGGTGSGGSGTGGSQNPDGGDSDSGTTPPGGGDLE